ncbi:alpha/beta hydrolase [Methylobacterium sp. Leaf361]|uniref:alpha/beta fold hydrolase n=1 Tax=unclassified Methylobacterium TaxID=2615210 RepID=UPI0006F90842|nr:MULTISPECIES: alpha/beta hydrolase [unclassified Methylobacterium]KQS67176.1 alpha/beta hydrolase [Methylobacterium sp. Leaf361]SEH27377.1 Pimeloyl-ACP methyl ester carboxylesterase [Methylobacterium sp. 275MFSha3.1]
MAVATETLPGPARPAREAGTGTEADPRIVPRRIVSLADDRTIAYAETGAGPDLVAIHGTLMCLEDVWLGPVPALAEHFRVVAVDRPGHGFSRRPRGGGADIWDQAASIREAVRRLGLERPVILGHSFGGAVALAYGMLHPDEVAGIVALAPICFPEPRLEQVLFGPRALPFGGDALSAFLGASSDRALLPLLWNAMFFPEAMPARFARDFPFALAGRPAQITAEGEDAGWLWPGLARSVLGYPSLRRPTRILGGSADLVVNTELHGRRAAGLIPGARFESLPGAGHMLHHLQTDAVVRAALAVRSEA